MASYKYSYKNAQVIITFNHTGTHKQEHFKCSYCTQLYIDLAFILKLEAFSNI